jgi:hypothetical protein
MNKRETSGKRVIFMFGGGAFALALIGLVIITLVLRTPPVERDQRKMADLLSNAFQKFRMDNGRWPVDARDAAVNFSTESPDLFEKVKKAENDWGLATSVLEPKSATPELIVTFSKPQSQERRYALMNKERRPR